MEGIITEEYIAIGYDIGDNLILLKVRGENVGEVYYWNHDIFPDEKSNIHFLATHIQGFLNMLHGYEE